VPRGAPDQSDHQQAEEQDCEDPQHPQPSIALGKYLADYASVPQPQIDNGAGILPRPLAVAPWIRLLLLTAVVLQLGDAVTFAIGSQMIGIGYESNGLVRTLYHHGGLDAVLFMKGGAILLTVAVLVVLARRLPKAFMIGAAVTALFGLVGLFSNTTTVAFLFG
jgi:hypothetical protein